MGIFSQLKHAWNAFTDQDPSYRQRDITEMGSAYGQRPDRVRFRMTNERTIITSIYTRIAVDVASIDIRHVRLDGNRGFKEDMDSGLQNCLTVEANIDQGPSHFKRDIILSLFDKGTIAVVPVDTNISPTEPGSLDIKTLRVGTITNWWPQHVRVDLYNDRTGRHEQVTLPKSTVAIIENPLYTVMNEPNSTLQRLMRKLSLLDAVDEQSSSGKLDMIIQLPYTIKTEALRTRAEQRRKDIEFQLKGSQYGIAYTDGTEKITQLNRPAENNLQAQVEYLVEMLYGQLGITPEVMNGTADEATMLNYINRTIEPLLDAIQEEFIRKFITKSGRTQGQTILYFRDPFKLVPMKDIAEMADKLTRNEIVTGNEFRGFIGIKPSTDPKADELRNSNMPRSATDLPTDSQGEVASPEGEPVDGEGNLDPYANINETLDGVFASLGVDG